MHLKANLVMLNVPSDNVPDTRNFFENLLGIEFIRNLAENEESYHAPISEDGIDLYVSPVRDPQETPMFYFHVDDLNSTLGQVNEFGGQVVFGPEDVAMSDQAFSLYNDAMRRVEPDGPQAVRQLGRVAIVTEPSGRAVGLIELAEHVHSHYEVGRHQKPLTEKQLRHYTAGRHNARRMFAGGPGGGGPVGRPGGSGGRD